MNQQVIDLIVVWLLFLIPTSVIPLGAAALLRSGGGKVGCLPGLIVLPLITIVAATLNGLAVLILWGIIAPVFGWPPLTLIESIAISWLVAVLGRSAGIGSNK